MKLTVRKILTLEAILCAAWVLLGSALPEIFGTLLGFPFQQMGLGLRWLSLSGWAGNLAAIVLYLLICLSPVAYLIFRKDRRREDWLLLVLTVLLFPVLYLMVNPQLMGSWLGQVYAMVGSQMLGIALWSVLGGWAFLKVLNLCFRAGESRLLDWLRWLIYGYCGLLVLNVSGIRLAGLQTTLEAFAQSNQGTIQGIELTHVFFVVQYLVDILPDLLLIWVLLDACGVLEILKTEGYTEKLTQRAEGLSRKCAAMLTLSTLTNVAFNLVQLLLLKNLRNVSTVTTLPLESLLFAVGLLVIARFIRAHQQLQAENDSFI